MKKTFAVIVALLFLFGLTNFTFAQEKKHKAAKTTQESTEVTTGSVTSVDKTNKQIVVKDSKTGTEKTFTVSEKAIAIVKVGDEVKVKTKAGSDNAESVKIIKTETKKK